MKRIALACGLSFLIMGCGLVIGLESSYDPLPPVPDANVEASGDDASTVPTADACPDAGCKECVPGDFRCTGLELQQCADGFFKPLETCESADKCSATGGNCLGIYCTPGQRRCNKDRLERCNAAQTTFENELTCGVGLCDAIQKRCNNCIPSTNIGCFGPQSVERCSDDGQTTSYVACVPPKPKCVASPSGVACLECVNDTHCSTVAPCRAPQCVNGACTTKADATQDGRVLVPAEDRSCVQTVCMNGQSTAGHLPPGTMCGQGQGFGYFCQADGSCVGAP